jgi:DNA-binding transcriptional ArsR family regulator
MTDQQALPADINAERSTLGAILLERDAILAIAPWLQPDHFYFEKHAWIYEAALACYQRRVPPDVSTIADELRRRKRLEAVGGMTYLGGLSTAVPTAMHVEYYARIVTRTATLRALIESGGHISAMGYDEGRELDELLRQAKTRLDSLRDTGTIPRGIAAPDLIRLPVEPVRWVVPGLISQGFGYLAAKPGAGKTWLMLQWAVSVASGGKVLGEIDVQAAPVLFLALEDTKASLKERMEKVCNGERPPQELICFCEDDGWKPLDDGGLEQLEQAIQSYQPAMVFIDTLTAIAPEPDRRTTNPYRAEYQSFLPVRHLAETYSVAIIGSVHFNKSGRVDVLELVNGTMGLPAVSINRIGLVREPEHAQARMLSKSKRGPEADWMLEFDTVTCGWRKLGDTRLVQASEERRAILEFLANHDAPATIKEIAEALDKGYHTVAQLLKRMAEEAQVVKPDRGRYQLPDKGQIDSREANFDPTTPDFDPILIRGGSDTGHPVQTFDLLIDSGDFDRDQNGDLRSKDQNRQNTAPGSAENFDPPGSKWIKLDQIPERYHEAIQEAHRRIVNGKFEAASMVAYRFEGDDRDHVWGLVDRMIDEHKTGHSTLL